MRRLHFCVPCFIVFWSTLPFLSDTVCKLSAWLRAAGTAAIIAIILDTEILHEAVVSISRVPSLVLRWAFGVLVYFALYGRYPFDGNNVREILLTVLHGTIEWDSDVSWLQWPSFWPRHAESPIGLGFRVAI